MLTFISYMLVFWLGVGIGFFLRQLAAMAACIVFAVLVLSPTSAKAECLPSAQAVWQAHGGGHATWRASGDHRCWMVGHGWRHVARLPSPREKPRQFVKEAEIRSLLPEKPNLIAPLPAGSPQAVINQAFAVLGMGR